MSRANLKVRQEQMRSRWEKSPRYPLRRTKAEFRRTPDSELWFACEVASRATNNPALKDALIRASEILKAGVQGVGK